MPGRSKKRSGFKKERGKTVEVRRKRTAIRYASLFMAMLSLVCMVFMSPFSAKGVAKRSWMRAKITYEFDEGVTGLNDSILTFANDKWRMGGDGWYYYEDLLKDGDKIRFIDGVKVPPEWTEEISNKKFRIIVTVEVGEAIKGETGFKNNEEALYSESFELWSMGYKDKDGLQAAKKDKMTVKVREYQLDENGNLGEYKNDKTIIPGQYVSKIVEFELVRKKGLFHIQTGDMQFGTMIFMGAAAIAAVGGIAVVAKKKKKETEK